jgi:hypothetical protein
MIRVQLLNDVTNETRNSIGQSGLVAVINNENKPEGQAVVMIDLMLKNQADYAAILKELLKQAVEDDRKVFANAIYHACKDSGFLSDINGAKCLVFKGEAP